MTSVRARCFWACLAAALTGCAQKQKDDGSGTADGGAYFGGLLDAASPDFVSRRASWTMAQREQAALCFPGLRCRENPQPLDGNLRRVWATAVNDVWAVGEQGLVRHWDGTAISTVAIPGVNDTFVGVWASGPSDVWVVSDNGAWRWDGQTWASALTFAKDSTDRGQDVAIPIWGSATDDVWIGGAQPSHWNGSSWESVPVPKASNVMRVFSGRARDDLWALQDGPFLSHWDGKAWSDKSLSESCNAIWEGPTGLVWLVGASGRILRVQGAVETVAYAGAQVTSAARVAHGLWGTSDRDLWMVGDSGGAAYLLHLDGNNWVQFESPGSEAVVSVGGATSNDVWAVGASGAMFRWDGSRWNSPAPATLSSQEILAAVHGSGPEDVWVLRGGGYNTPASLDHWDGANWRHLPIPTFHQITSRGIWADGSGRVWVFGDPNTLRWNGKTWDVFRIVPGLQYGGWGSGPNDLWAAGQGGLVHWDGVVWSASVALRGTIFFGAWGRAADDVYAFGVGSLAHWDGTRWTVILSAPDRTFNSVWASGTDDIWATATDMSTPSGPGALVHWDGVRWKDVARGNFGALTGTGPRDVWVTQPAGPLQLDGPLLHWDGTAWAPDGPSDARALRALWVDRTNHLWAVGLGGVVARHAESGWQLSPRRLDDQIIALTGPSADVRFAVTRSGVLAWDGARWASIFTGSDLGSGDAFASQSVGVSAPDRTHLWVVGSGASVVNWDGTSWQRQSRIGGPGRGDERFTGVWAAAANDVWLVGTANALAAPGTPASLWTIMHSDGTKWALQGPTPTGAAPAVSLFGVMGKASDDVWAYGARGTMLHWNGFAWSKIPVATQNDILMVSGPSSRLLWALARSGSGPPDILLWNDQAWKVWAPSAKLTGTAIVTQLWAVGEDDVWLAEQGGGIRHWDGEIWTRVLVPGMPANALWSLWGDDAGAVWAAGGNGQILQLQRDVGF